MKKCPHCNEWDLSAREAKQIGQLHAMSPVTSAEVRKRYGLSSSNASNRLRKWERAGFLVRTEVDAKSGGIEHV